MNRPQRHTRVLCVASSIALQLVARAHSPPRVVAAASMNLGFEEAERGLPTGWSAGPLGGFDVAPDTVMVHAGRRSVRISSTPDGRYGSLHDNLPPGERMVVSAHNLHIADLKNRMGKHVRAALGSAWLTIGLELGDGTFQALRARTDGTRPKVEAITFTPPPAGHVDAALLRGGPDVDALDLRTLPATGEVAAWFRSPS